MQQPVATHDGQVYERSAIEEWFRQGQRSSPVTGLELDVLALSAQPALQAAISVFMSHPAAPKEGADAFTSSSAGAVQRGETGEPTANERSMGSGRESSHRGTNGPQRQRSGRRANEGASADEAAEVRRLLDGLQSELRRAEEEAATSSAATSILTEPMEMARQVLSSAATGGTGASTGGPLDDGSHAGSTLTAQMLQSGSQLLYPVDSVQEQPMKSTIRNQRGMSRNRNSGPESRDRTYSPIGHERESRNRSRSPGQPQSRSVSPSSQRPVAGRSAAAPASVPGRHSLSRSHLRRSASQEGTTAPPEDQQRPVAGAGRNTVTRATPRKSGMSASGTPSNSVRSGIRTSSPGAGTRPGAAGRASSPGGTGGRPQSPNRRAQSPGTRGSADGPSSPTSMYTYEGPLPPGYGPGKIPRCALPSCRGGTRFHPSTTPLGASSSRSSTNARATSPKQSSTGLRRTGSIRDLAGAASSQQPQRQRNLEDGLRGPASHVQTRPHEKVVGRAFHHEEDLAPESGSTTASAAHLQPVPTSAGDQHVTAELAADIAANWKAQQAMQERFRSQWRAEAELPLTHPGSEAIQDRYRAQWRPEVELPVVLEEFPKEVGHDLQSMASSLHGQVLQLQEDLNSRASVDSGVMNSRASVDSGITMGPTPTFTFSLGAASAQLSDSRAQLSESSCFSPPPALTASPTTCEVEESPVQVDDPEGHPRQDDSYWAMLGDQPPSESSYALERGRAGGSSANSTDEAGRTALMHAAGEGDAQALRRQLSRGAAVDATDECRCTALMYAATYGHLEAVRCLAEHGAAVEATSKDGWTPLITAAYNGHLEVVRHLLSRGACIEASDERGWTSLMHVAFNGDNETLRCLLQSNAEVDTLDSDGRTALVYAAFNGHLENVRSLLQRSVKEPHGEPMLEGARDTALLFASIHGHAEVVQLLLEVATASPETRHAALKLAADHGHHGVVELLVRRSAVDLQLSS